jgi:hypothetical protein
MKETPATDLRPFGNLIARCRRDALRIIADDKPNTKYRLGLIGECLVAAFNEIDASTTLEQRLMLLGANPADARDVKPGHDSMMHLLWAHSLEWSAMRRGDEWNSFEHAPLYWAVSYVMLDLMKTDEAKPSVDAAFRAAFGGTFDELATRADANDDL